MKEGTNLSRRDFLRRLGVGAGSAMAMYGCSTGCWTIRTTTIGTSARFR
ncbi:MAG: twin-arginine translocation signal domain-containing protein [Prevotella sp.]|nr:twin-arginine translocation signal domain-containing protein [Prevotella sp.]MBQ3845632.1 twin-arginine translocation signal domain-containing protein [Bacteroidales bacterium]